VLGFSAGEPVLDAFLEESGHGSWCEVSGEVVVEIGGGFETGGLPVFTRAVVDVGQW